MISYIIRTDGRREYIPTAIATAEDYLKADFDQKFIVDDSGDAEYAAWLEISFPSFKLIHHPVRMGMEAGVRTAYEAALASGSDYIFATEDDFIFNRPVNVRKMARLLHCESHLASLTLKRNPWSPEEIAAGGQMEMSPSEYTDRSCPCGNWVEHEHLFSFNPSLITRTAIEIALNNSENMLELGVSQALTAQDLRFAYYGRREDAPRCEHIGYMRSAGYSW